MLTYPLPVLLVACQEEIEALKQQLAASLGAADSSGGGQIAAATSAGASAAGAAPPAAGSDAHASRQPSEQQQQTPSLSPPATAAAPEPASMGEDQALQQRPTEHTLSDDAVVASGEAFTVATGAEQTGEINKDSAARTSELQDGVATTGMRASEGGQMGREGKASDRRKTEDLTEDTQTASANQPVPEVVVQEKIVERVVVEEKVRVLSNGTA